TRVPRACGVEAKEDDYKFFRFPVHAVRRRRDRSPAGALLRAQWGRNTSSTYTGRSLEVISAYAPVAACRNASWLLTSMCSPPRRAEAYDWVQAAVHVVCSPRAGLKRRSKAAPLLATRVPRACGVEAEQGEPAWIEEVGLRLVMLGQFRFLACVP